MAGRILTLQRQARELGRLRAGWSEPYTDKHGKERLRPVKSTTWLLSSPQREYLDAAAEAWGGAVEEWQPQGNGPKVWRVVTEASAVDAILPPGDPLSQAYEMWSKGGCQRRCDGETESLSGKPCLCREQFGDQFYLQPPEAACRPTTRLNVILPDLPDLGVWRMESHGFYAANEIAAAVDLIRHATGGALAVPIRLRIEPRTRVAQGKTKQFLVVVVEIRGATAGQILGGSAPTVALDAGPQRQAIEAGPAGNGSGNGGSRKTAEQYAALAKLARNVEQVRSLWKDAVADEALDEGLAATLKARVEALKNGGQPAEPAAPAEPEVVEGEPEPDADALYTQVLNAAGERGWSASELDRRFQEDQGVGFEDADGFQLAVFLEAVQSGAVA